MSTEGIGGGFKVTPKAKGKLSPIKNRVIVSDMHFGEQITKGGLIITDDNGSTRGIYPRWCKVHAKGPDNTDSYEVGDWILVEHGRWTRGIDVDEGNGEHNFHGRSRKYYGLEQRTTEGISTAKRYKCKY